MKFVAHVGKNASPCEEEIEKIIKEIQKKSHSFVVACCTGCVLRSGPWPLVGGFAPIGHHVACLDLFSQPCTRPQFPLGFDDMITVCLFPALRFLVYHNDRGPAHEKTYLPARTSGS